MSVKPSSRSTDTGGMGAALRRTTSPAAGAALLVALCLCCAGTTPERTLVVTATAYNALPGQTVGDPNIAAWGDRLEPGMKVIAVSRDLLELGLGRGQPVRIDGLPGTYRVLDKTASRWTRRIDIFMGVDREAALQWGKRQVRIRWIPDSR